jgi:four helix bundle protein
VQKEKSDLAVRTKNFALQIIRFFPKLPRTTEAQILGKQLLRAATSVGANYREAYRGRSKAEFIAKCGDSLRELEETGYWLELLLESNLVAQETITPLETECHERFSPKPNRRLP